MEIVENCKTCKHSVFDEKWGEYKCKKLEKRLALNSNVGPLYTISMRTAEECEFYQKDKNKIDLFKKGEINI